MSKITIGENIKRLREKYNISQSDLAEKLEVSQSAIANYEKNTRVPQIDQLLALSEVFSVSLDSLVGNDKNKYHDFMLNGDKLDWIKLSDAFIDLLKKREFEEARAYVSRLYQGTNDIKAIILNFMRYAMTKIGWLWEVGEISISDEHMMSQEIDAITTELIHDVGKYHTDFSLKSLKIVGILAEGEKHTYGLKALLQLLQLYGATTIYLGPHIPLDDLQAFIQREKPNQVIYHVTMPYYLEAAVSEINQLKYRYHCDYLICGAGAKEAKFLLADQKISTYDNLQLLMEARYESTR